MLATKSARMPIITVSDSPDTEGGPKTARENVIRVTGAIAQYDVSARNPQALENLGKAIAGSLDRDDVTYYDPELRSEVKLGDVLVAVNLNRKDCIILSHRDSAGMGDLGDLVLSANYIFRNPLKTFAMKALGVVADPEVIYKQKIVQLLAQLDREGLFGQPGSSTFSLEDWKIETSNAWRDIIITRAEKEEKSTGISLSDACFGAFKIGAA